MRGKKAAAAALCLAAAVLVVCGLLWYRGMMKRREIVSFETVLLAESGMRVSSEYEIVCRDGGAELTYYIMKYADGEARRVPEKSVVCGEDEILALLNACGAAGWDGFVGKHPRGVKDGTMFTFTAVVNGGERIYAHGSENFPKRYREFKDGLRALLFPE